MRPMSKASRCFGYVHFQEKKSAKLALKALKINPHPTWQVTHFMPDHKTKDKMQTEALQIRASSKDQISTNSFPVSFEQNENLIIDSSQIESETYTSKNSQEIQSGDMFYYYYPEDDFSRAQNVSEYQRQEYRVLERQAPVEESWYYLQYPVQQVLPPQRGYSSEMSPGHQNQMYAQDYTHSYAQDFSQYYQCGSQECQPHANFTQLQYQRACEQQRRGLDDQRQFFNYAPQSQISTDHMCIERFFNGSLQGYQPFSTQSYQDEVQRQYLRPWYYSGDINHNSYCGQINQGRDLSFY